MTAPLRVTLSIDGMDGCPLAEASADVGAAISQTTRASSQSSDGLISEEFVLPADAGREPSTAEPVFETDTERVYRFERAAEEGCACDLIERTGSPITNLSARDGSLWVTFHAPSLDGVREILDALMASYEEIQVKQLYHGTGDSAADLVLVDRSELTTRQREVLETSFEMGYFEHPKGANASEISAVLDINPSTFREHLAAAQRKLLGALLDG